MSDYGFVAQPPKLMSSAEERSVASYLSGAADAMFEFNAVLFKKMESLSNDIAGKKLLQSLIDECNNNSDQYIDWNPSCQKQSK